MGKNVRRVVTGHTQDGKSVFISDGEPPCVINFKKLPGLKFIELWTTDDIPSIPVNKDDPTVLMKSFVPGPSGTRFLIFQLPPEQEIATIIDKEGLAAFKEEYVAKAPGLAETHENEDLAMHTTDTIDYGIVLSGEVWLELDDGSEVHLKQGDCYVQNGTRHAWRNRRSDPCVIAVVMIGAVRS